MIKEQEWSASSIITMIIMSLIYGGLVTLIIILLKTQYLNEFIRRVFCLKEEINGQLDAYSKVFSFYIISFLPTFFYYLFYQSPIPIKKKSILIIFSVLVLLAIIGLDVLFFLKFSDCKSLISHSLIFEIIIKVALILSQIFFIAEYVFLLVKTEEIKFPQKEGDGIKDTISYAIKSIDWGITHLKNNHSNIYIIICTLFSLFIGMILVGVLIIIIGIVSLIVTPIGIIYILGRKSGESSDSSNTKNYTFTNSMGCESTVHSDDGRSFYDSQGSYVGHSDDGGNTIIED